MSPIRPLLLLLLGTLAMAAFAVGSTVFGHPAIAHAGWNNLAYEQCMRQAVFSNRVLGPDVLSSCCTDSGGSWTGTECRTPGGPPGSVIVKPSNPVNLP
jgi:hypothetical protein